MKRHTTMLVGGPAQFWVEPSTFKDFQRITAFCRKRSIPTFVIGRGSNLLVRDGGIKGLVIHPKGGEFSQITPQGSRIQAGAGVRFKKLANTAYEHSIGGFEWMEGIPGNVGGGMRMNAGAMGIETFDQVIECTVLNEQNEIVTYAKNEISHSYRSAPTFRTEYVLSVLFEGDFADKDDIKNLLDQSKEKRKTSQPISANAGCTFKNPPTVPAGMLIDQLGLKGAISGKAQISDIHANFFTNTGKATATDLLSLIQKTQNKALKQQGITLETEVQIIGEDVCEF